MSDPDAKAAQKEYDHARQAHDLHYRSIEKSNDAAITSSLDAIKNLFLMHGGALVAMLAFISGLLSSDGKGVAAASLIQPMLYFSFGLAAATAASMGAYLTNFCYGSALSEIRLTWSHPYTEEAGNSRAWQRAGARVHVASVLFSFVSLVLFVLGFWSVSSSLVLN